MNNLHSKAIPPLTKEQIWRLYQLSKMTDDEIDFSDIPEITHEEFQRAFARKRAKQKKKFKNCRLKNLSRHFFPRFFYATIQKN